jgi:hypothetical protein
MALTIEITGIGPDGQEVWEEVGVEVFVDGADDSQEITEEQAARFREKLRRISDDLHKYPMTLARERDEREAVAQRLWKAILSLPEAPVLFPELHDLEQ